MLTKKKTVLSALVGGAVLGGGLIVGASPASAQTDCYNIGGENKDGGVVSANCYTYGASSGKVKFRANCRISGYKDTTVATIPSPGINPITYLLGHCVTGASSWTYIRL